MTNNSELHPWLETSPFTETLGIEVISATNGESRTLMRLTPAVSSRKGDISGGAVAAMLDITAAYALRSDILPKGYRGSATISMTTNFLGRARGDVTGIARATKVGGTIAWVDARIESEGNSIVATASCLFRLIK